MVIKLISIINHRYKAQSGYVYSLIYVSTPICWIPYIYIYWKQRYSLIYNNISSTRSCNTISQNRYQTYRKNKMKIEENESEIKKFSFSSEWTSFYSAQWKLPYRFLHFIPSKWIFECSYSELCSRVISNILQTIIINFMLKMKVVLINHISFMHMNLCKEIWDCVDFGTV